MNIYQLEDYDVQGVDAGSKARIDVCQKMCIRDSRNIAVKLIGAICIFTFIRRKADMWLYIVCLGMVGPVSYTHLSYIWIL